MIRVLVVEDSAVAREYLVHLFDQDPALEVVGIAKDGLEAVEQAEHLRPDIITMDVHMPRMNGYEATRRIMERTPTPIVMMSAYTSDDVPMAFDALKAGAVALVDKPPGAEHSHHAGSICQLLEQVKLMAKVKVVKRMTRREFPVSQAPPLQRDRKLRLIAIGASTGGPAAVAEILNRLTGELPPILVVQHIAPGFTIGLAEWLSRSTALTVKVAEGGEQVRPATVYVAPNGGQMGITNDGRITLTQEAAKGGFSPSATYLFRSVAETYGPCAVGILLSGMGRDGVSGLLRMRQTGGITFAQDEESSVIFGMPQEAIRAGAAVHVLSPARIANAISSLVAYGK
jgi:two-component system chemotaxis response regulator CheB